MSTAPVLTLQGVRNDLISERAHEIQSLSESRADLLKEYWLLLRNREELARPLQPEGIKDDEELFLRRYSLPTSIDDLHVAEVPAMGLGPLAPPPPPPAYAQLAASNPDSQFKEDPIDNMEEYARPEDVNMPTVEELGWKAKRVKSNKKKKNKDKDKDKENGSGGSNWQPMDFARWIATIKANPTHTALSRVPPKPITTPPTTKPPPPHTPAQVMQRQLYRTITTADWNTAIREKKLLNVHTRILELQRSALWSFRQPKRQKEPAYMLGKSHWDWMKDEALWMSRDFREERKWKAMVGWRIGQELRDKFDPERPLKRRKLDGDGLGEDVMQVDGSQVETQPEAGPSKVAPAVPPTKILFEELGADPESEIVEVLEVDDGVAAELEAFEADKAAEQDALEAGIKEEEMPMEIDSPPSSPAIPRALPLTKEEEEVEMQDAQEVEEFAITIPDVPPDPPTSANPTPIVSPPDGSLAKEQAAQLPTGLRPSSINPAMPTLSRETVEDPRPRPTPVRQSSAGPLAIDQVERWKGRKAIVTADEDDFLFTIDLKTNNPIKQESKEGVENKVENVSKEAAMEVEEKPKEKENKPELEDLFPRLSITVADDTPTQADILRGLFPELVVYTLESSSNKGSAASPTPGSRNSPAVGEPRVVPLLLSKKDRPQLAQSVTKVYTGPGTSRFLTGKPIIYSALPGARWVPSPDLKRLKAGMHPITANDYRFAGKSGRWDNLDEWVCVVDDALIPAFREKEREKLEKLLADAEAGLVTAPLFTGRRQPLPVWPSGFVLSRHPRPMARRAEAEHSGAGQLTPHVPTSPWTPIEDAFLKVLVDRYANNWEVILEAFRSNRRIKSDGECQRGLWEIVERWGVITGVFKKIAQAQMANGVQPIPMDEDPNTPVLTEPTTPKVGMATRGIKRRASQAAQLATPSRATESPGPPAAREPPGWETRRRRRHLYVIDAIRKVVKKREAAIKPNGARKPVVTTNNEVKTKVPTAAELCKLKFERDAQEKRAQQQQDQYRRMLLEQRRAGIANPAIPGVLPNGAPAPPGTPVAGPVAAAAAATAAAIANAGAQMPLPNGTQAEAAAAVPAGAAGGGPAPANPGLPVPAPPNAAAAAAAAVAAAAGPIPRPISAAANANVVAQLRAQAATGAMGQNLGVGMNGINISQHGQQVQRLQQQLGNNVPLNLSIDNAALRRAQLARMGINPQAAAAAAAAVAQGRSATPQAGGSGQAQVPLQANGQAAAGTLTLPPQVVPGVDGIAGMRPGFPPNLANMTPEQLQQMRAHAQRLQSQQAQILEHQRQQLRQHQQQQQAVAQQRHAAAQAQAQQAQQQAQAQAQGQGQQGLPNQLGLNNMFPATQ